MPGNMHLSPNICTVLLLVCLQLWTIHGKADVQLVKTARNARMRDALSRLNRSPQEAIRRDRRGTGCFNDWKAGNHRDNNPKTCQRYIEEKWCTEEGALGPRWKDKWGNFTNYADADGNDARVCPQCGCGKDLSVKTNIFPITVDLTTILNDINTRFQTMSQSHAQMKTQISGMEATIEGLEGDVVQAIDQINEHSTNIETLTQDIIGTNEKIKALSEFAGMFTYVSTAAKNAEAEAECVKQGGHLASLDNDAKLEYVKEQVMPQDGTKVWLGAECVGCSVVNEDKWQWKSGSKLGLDHPLWAKNYGLYGKDLPYDAISNNAVHLTMLCNGECEFINHAAYTEHPFLCEKSSDGSWKMTNTDRKEGEEEDTMP